MVAFQQFQGDVCWQAMRKTKQHCSQEIRKLYLSKNLNVFLRSTDRINSNKRVQMQSSHTTK